MAFFGIKVSQIFTEWLLAVPSAQVVHPLPRQNQIHWFGLSDVLWLSVYIVTTEKLWCLPTAHSHFIARLLMGIGQSEWMSSVASSVLTTYLLSQYNSKCWFWFLKPKALCILPVYATILPVFHSGNRKWPLCPLKQFHWLRNEHNSELFIFWNRPLLNSFYWEHLTSNF